MSEYKIEWRSNRFNFGVSGKTAPGKIRRWIEKHLGTKIATEIQRYKWRKLIVEGHGKPSDLTDVPQKIVNDDNWSWGRSLMHCVPTWVEVAYRSKRFHRRRGQVDTDPGVLPREVFRP